MRSQILHATVCCIAGLALAGAARSAAPEIIAKGGSTELAGADVRLLLADLPEATRKAVATDLPTLDQLVRAEIARRALVGEARSAGLDRDAATKALLDRVRDDALLRLWVTSRVQVPAEYPSAAELQAAYEANQSQLTPGAEYRLAQIFIAAPDGGDAQKLVQALRKSSEVGGRLAATGADFAKLAREYSEHAPSAAQGGDLGVLPENRLLPEVALAVKNLKPGDVAGPIKTTQGLHFVKLVESKPAQIPTLAQVRDQLRDALRNQREQEMRQAFLDDAGRKLNIVVNQVELARLQQSLR